MFFVPKAKSKRKRLVITSVQGKINHRRRRRRRRRKWKGFSIVSYLRLARYVVHMKIDKKSQHQQVNLVSFHSSIFLWYKKKVGSFLERKYTHTSRLTRGLIIEDDDGKEQQLRSDSLSM
jgi:hypothetical protein